MYDEKVRFDDLTRFDIVSGTDNIIPIRFQYTIKCDKDIFYDLNQILRTV